MKTLYLERSSGGGRDGSWTESLDLEGVERIVVGIGPGSFAGIRSALAFAQGYSLARKCELLGLPSPAALVEPEDGRLAVIGDARRGKFWIALYEGYAPVRDIFQTEEPELVSSVPEGFVVTTPDESRIGALLAEKFAGRYLGGRLPTPEGLRRAAEANPAALREEPLPIYLNPAVR